MRYLIDSEKQSVGILCGIEVCPINTICGVVACPVNIMPCGLNICGIKIP